MHRTQTPTQDKTLVQKTCTMCGEVLDISSFKRTLTLRQSKALLKRPQLRTRITVISSRCKYCWHATKRKTPLTIKDIYNKKASGDMHSVKADIMLKELIRAKPERRAKVMKEVWHKRFTEPMIESLTQQLAIYKKRYFSTKNKLNYSTKSNGKQNSQDNQDTLHALLRQHSEDYELAKQLRKELMAQIKLAKNKSDLPTQINLHLIINNIKQTNERNEA